MRYIPANLQAALDKGRVATIDMILFDLPSPHGLCGFHSWSGSFDYNGTTYKGIGNLIEISEISYAANGVANGMSLKLNDNQGDGYDYNVLSVIESINYQDRPVYVFRRYCHPETYEPIATIPFFAGEINFMDHSYTEGGGALLRCSVETGTLDLGRSGYRVRSDADQRQIDANDGSLKRAGTVVTKELKWSSFEPQKAKKKKFLGIF